MAGTAGFYKLAKDGGALVYAPNRVTGPRFSLDAKNPPKAGAVDGWQWYDTRDAAVKALGYVEPPDETTCTRRDCPDRITS
jgi:hypothetical protein